MSAPVRNPVSTPSNVSPRRGIESSSARSTPPATGQGLARSPSIRQSRPVRRSTARMSTSYTPDSLEQEEEDAQIMTDMKEQLRLAEQSAEQYRKQADTMQKRIDDATNEQTAAEERDYQRQTELDKLRAEIRELTRQRREIEITHSSEKRLLLQDRERSSRKEIEMQAVINRLNETLRNKGLEDANTSRAATFDDTPTQASMDFSPLLHEKDATIESLRIELAELHLKVAEQEHMGDGRLQDLEKNILETKMQNARLLEENESFQMLLSEKTLKGDFMPTEDAGLSSLAEELESAGDDPEAQGEIVRKLEAENRAAKESNKALNLYIDKIIGRILQHPGLEHVIVDGDKETPPPPPPKHKALPVAPGEEVTAAAAVSGFLQRAKSVVSRGPPRPSRPISYAQPTANENPETAPSIPINRGHRRARSDQAEQDMRNAGAAVLVQQMNRGSPLRTVSGGPMSPGISPLSPKLVPRQNYFPSRTPSGNVPTGSSRNSITSEHSLEREHSSTDGSSAHNSMSLQVSSQPSVPANKENSTIPGAVMKQNQLRPLRLVNAQEEEEKARKAANRQSWMGWFRGSAVEGIQEDEQNSRANSRERTSTWQT